MPQRPEQRSLFGEILDWMLAPLLLIWPISVALTWLVAQGIASRPYDRELGEMARNLGLQVAAADAPSAAHEHMWQPVLPAPSRPRLPFRRPHTDQRQQQRALDDLSTHVSTMHEDTDSVCSSDGYGADASDAWNVPRRAATAAVYDHSEAALFE